MAWDVLNGLKKFKQIAFVKLLGETVGTATNAQALLKDINGNVIMARTTAAVSTLQKKRGFAKGCILLVDASGPANQNTKGLYENVGTAKLSRFNLVGQVTDPEFLLDSGRLLIGDANGIARARTISGAITISSTGVVSLSATVAGTHRTVAAGVSAPVTDADGMVRVYDDNIAAGDVVLATLRSSTHIVQVRNAQAHDGHINVYLTAEGGPDTSINYQVLRAVNSAPATELTTGAPTTATASTMPPLSTEVPLTTEAPTTAA